MAVAAGCGGETSEKDDNDTTRNDARTEAPDTLEDTGSNGFGRDTGVSVSDTGTRHSEDSDRGGRDTARPDVSDSGERDGDTGDGGAMVRDALDGTDVAETGEADTYRPDTSTVDTGTDADGSVSDTGSAVDGVSDTAVGGRDTSSTADAADGGVDSGGGEVGPDAGFSCPSPSSPSPSTGSPTGPAKLLADINKQRPDIEAKIKEAGPHLVPYGANDVVFNGELPHIGSELIFTDGTSKGTSMMDQDRGQGGRRKNVLGVAGNKVIYSIEINNEYTLYATDGTKSGTTTIFDPSSLGPRQRPPGFETPGTKVGNKLLIPQSSLGNSLYVTDGTKAGTKEIYTPSGAAGIEFLTRYGGETVWGRHTRTGYDEIFISDGTAAGSHALMDYARIQTYSVLGVEVVGTELVILRQNSLWKSDGTYSGTSEYYRFQPQAKDPKLLGRAGGYAIWMSYQTGAGFEIWRTDGTQSGTTFVKDIYPGSSDSDPKKPVQIGSKLVFWAMDGTHGSEPWITDGTTTGTRLLLDVNSGSNSSYSTGAHAVRAGLHYLGVRASANANPILTTDGTVGGTSTLQVGPSTHNADGLRSTPHGLYVLMDEYSSIDELHLYDPSSGTSRLLAKDEGFYWNETVFQNGRIFWPRSDPNSSSDWNDTWWTSDGTKPGTHPVAADGTADSDPAQITPYKNGAIFVASDGQHGRELWKTDGTASGTTLVRDIRPGAKGSAPEQLVTFNGDVYFTAVDGTHGRELWTTDGTTAGTRMVKEFDPGTADGIESAYRPLLAAAPGALYVVADASGSKGLYRSDGTASGTKLAHASSTISDEIQWVQTWNCRAYFEVEGGFSSGPTLWRTQSNTGQGVQQIDSFYSIDERLWTGQTYAYFIGKKSYSDPPQLYRTDGTSNGTRKIAGAPSSTYSSDVGEFGAIAVVNGQPIYWVQQSTNPGAAFDLVTVDPQGNVTKLGPTASRGREEAPFGRYNAELVFRADGPGGIELWSTDGTQAGTHQMVDVDPNYDSEPADFSTYKGELFFTTEFGQRRGLTSVRRELWRTDGTPAGTQQELANRRVMAIRGTASTNIGVLYVVDHFDHGDELWIFE